MSSSSGRPSLSTNTPSTKSQESDLDAGQEHGMDADHAPQTLEASFAMAATPQNAAVADATEGSPEADPDELDAEDSRLEVDGDVSDVQSMSEHDDLGDTDVHTVAMGWDVSILLQAASPVPALTSLASWFGSRQRRGGTGRPGPDQPAAASSVWLTGGTGVGDVDADVISDQGQQNI
ncbi:unnamed protein product [Symbiodinium microadriaticum]|nr:unnamed protein product [Symbiodinium microadriaticum]CAE7722516.1 unnamed protein product [Symbiodinium sp. KB8]